MNSQVYLITITLAVCFWITSIAAAFMLSFDVSLMMLQCFFGTVVFIAIYAINDDAERIKKEQ